MAFRFNPRFKIGNVTLGKRGASVRTGIPGLTYRINYPTGTSANSFDTEEAPKAGKTLPSLLWNLIIFSLLAVLGIGFWGVVNKWMGLVYTLILLYVKSYPALFQDFTYGTKRVAVHKADRRYKYGSRIDGWKTVEDKDVIIPYDDQGKLLSRIEGTIGVVIAGSMLIFIFLKS